MKGERSRLSAGEKIVRSVAKATGRPGSARRWKNGGSSGTRSRRSGGPTDKIKLWNDAYLCPLLLLEADGDWMFAPWWKLSMEATMLAVEAQSVIAMRLTSIALGRGTHVENSRMVTEKAAAFVEAATTLATGGSADQVVRRYRKHVRDNGRRLRR